MIGSLQNIWRKAQTRATEAISCRNSSERIMGYPEVSFPIADYPYILGQWQPT
jgi:hypothetical protein